MKIFGGVAMAAALMVTAAANHARADTVVLTFDELNGGANEEPLNYYAGGFGSDGTGPGPNYGITFSSNAITGCQASAPCGNTNSNGEPSSPNTLFFLTGSAATMDVAGGFTTGFSFYYSAINQPGLINVYSGLDDTGTLLASLTIPTTPSNGDPSCGDAGFCPFVPLGVSFTGIAHSVDFGGTENQIGFDNITLGSAVPVTSAAPEPSMWALLMAGVGGLGLVLRRARRRAARGFGKLQTA